MNERKGYERVGRLIYGMQRICGGSEPLHALAAGDVDTDTLLLSKAIAGRYDALYARVLDDADAVTDEEVEALLADTRVLEEAVTRQCGAGWMWRGG
jgi:hypothetical protein